jgi:tRNA(adenine34) deaminase
MVSTQADIGFMELALEQARRALESGEVPVGAVVVAGGDVIGSGHNQPISSNDPTAHAEIVALRAAALAMRSYRLMDSTIYVTLEPCVMCVGALINARVARLVYGARDEKAGALGSVYDIGRDGRLNHRLEVVAGVAEARCADMLKTFFRERRGE